MSVVTIVSSVSFVQVDSYELTKNNLLGIRDLDDDEILEWMIYGQNFYPLKYSKVWYDMLVNLTVLD